MKAQFVIPSVAALALIACGAPQEPQDPDAQPANSAAAETQASGTQPGGTEADDGLSNVERELQGLYDQDRVNRRNELLASSDACFSETRAALLEPGQTLLERGPLAIDRVATAIDGDRREWSFRVIELSQAQRDAFNAAAGDFYRAAAEVHDYDTDDTIYHRDQSGTQCTVVKSPEIGRPLVEAATALQAELDAAGE